MEGSMEWKNWRSSRVPPSALLQDEDWSMGPIARRRLVEDQDTILELTGKLQELQNETNCMNDSRDFQDAESIRSRNSHVVSQSVSFPSHPIPGGMLSRSIGLLSRRKGPPSIWDTNGISGNIFCKSSCVLFRTVSASIASIEFFEQRASPFVHSWEKWKATTKSGSEMPVWTVSQKFSHLQWRRLFKELWGRPTTTADFRPPFWQVHHASHVCLLEDKVQDRGMYLFTTSYGSCALDQRSADASFSGWLKKFVLNTRNSHAEFWSNRCEDCFSTDQNHP